MWEAPQGDTKEPDKDKETSDPAQPCIPLDPVPGEQPKEAPVPQSGQKHKYKRVPLTLNILLQNCPLSESEELTRMEEDRMEREWCRDHGRWPPLSKQEEWDRLEWDRREED